MSHYTPPCLLVPHFLHLLYPTTERHGLFTRFASAISLFRAIYFNSTNVIHNIVTNSIHLGVLYEVRKEGRKTLYVMTTSFRPWPSVSDQTVFGIFMKFGMEILYKTLLSESKFYLAGLKNLNNTSKISIGLLRNVWISLQRFSWSFYFLNRTVYSFNTSNST